MFSGIHTNWMSKADVMDKDGLIHSKTCALDCYFRIPAAFFTDPSPLCAQALPSFKLHKCQLLCSKVSFSATFPVLVLPTALFCCVNLIRVLLFVDSLIYSLHTLESQRLHLPVFSSYGAPGQSDLWQQLLTGVIKDCGQKQLRKGRVCLGLWFRRQSPSWWGRPGNGDQTKELRLQSSTTGRKQRQNRKWGEAIRSRSPSPSGLWSTSSCKAAFPRTSITSRNSATSWDEVLEHVSLWETILTQTTIVSLRE